MNRTFDAETINALVNHPKIRPDVGGDGESWLDLAEVVAADRNVALIGEHGGFVYTWTAPETYEVHTFILPTGRGAQAYSMARESLDWMADHGARHIWTRVARGHRHTRLFTLKAGFKPCGEHTLDLGAGPVLFDLFNRRLPCP